MVVVLRVMERVGRRAEASAQAQSRLGLEVRLGGSFRRMARGWRVPGGGGAGRRGRRGTCGGGQLDIVPRLATEEAHEKSSTGWRGG